MKKPELEKTGPQRLKKKSEIYRFLSAGMFIVAVIYFLAAFHFCVSSRYESLNDSTVGLIMTGVFVPLIFWYVFKRISGKYYKQYSDEIASYVKPEEVFREYGAQVAYSQEGMLSRNDLLRMHGIREISNTVHFSGMCSVRGQYKDKDFLSANMRLTVKNGDDESIDQLYFGRITLLEGMDPFPGILLLLRPKGMQKSGFSRSFHNELRKMAGFTIGFGGKSPVSVDSQLDQKWEAYTNHEEAAENLLNTETALRKMLIEQWKLGFCPVRA